MSGTFLYEVNQNNFLNQPCWAQYNLKQAPFADTVQYAMYYPFPLFQQHLRYLRDFCTNSAPLLVIEGELGLGKSMLLAQFAAHCDNEATVYEIKGRSSITASQLIASIAQGFQLPLVLNQSTLREQMHAELAAMAQLEKTCILVIDDADLLPPETLTEIAYLAALQSHNKVHLYLLLSSEIKLHQYLENLIKEQNFILSIPTLMLMPLTFDETRTYIKHRLMKAGLKGKIPFSKPMLQTIYQLSNGVPGRINRVGQRMLLEQLKAPSKKRLHFYERIFANKKLYFTASGVIVFFALLSLTWNLTQHDKIKQSLTAARTTPAKPLAVKKQPQTIRIAKAEVIAAGASPALIKTTVPVTADTDKKSLIPQPETSTPPVQTQPVISLYKPYTAAEKELLTLQGYTLQLLGSRDTADLERLKRQAALKSGKVLAFTTQLENKPWHVLVYGHYATRAEAKAALEQLKKMDKALHPWIRPLTSVHQAIQQR